MSANLRDALLTLARTLQQAPPAAFVLGYLAGEAGRVRLCRHLPAQGLTCVLSAHGRLAVPVPVFQGWVNGVSMPDPFAWVAAIAELPGEVCVHIATDDPRLARWLEPLLQDDAPAVDSLTANLAQLRGRLDSALDVYNLCRTLLEEQPERAHELQRFLELARHDMEQLGQRLADLNRILHDRTGSQP